MCNKSINMETNIKIKKVTNGWIVEKDGKTFAHETAEGILQGVVAVINDDIAHMKSGDKYEIGIITERS